MASILGIGVATCDIVNVVADYPDEDAKVRALEQRISRGGNATNTLVVLSQLGHRCHWGGVLAGDEPSRMITAELEEYAVEFRDCPRHAGTTPTSYILLSRATGSRTIVHYRDVPEFSYRDFSRIAGTPYDWVHWEGRNIDETCQMLAHVRDNHPAVTCSVEIERARPGIERLFDQAQVLIFARAYVEAAGWTAPEAFLESMHGRIPHATLVCPWGAQGAVGISRDGRRAASPAFPPPRVVETVGAGDTFNAGLIDALVNGGDLSAALEHGCRLAGAKCGRSGFHLDIDAGPW